MAHDSSRLCLFFPHSLNQKCSHDLVVFWACAGKKEEVFVGLIFLPVGAYGGQLDMKNSLAKEDQP